MSETGNQMTLFTPPRLEGPAEADPQFAVQNKLMIGIIDALGVAATMQEIARREEERAEENKKLALIDPLTGLPNKRGFNEAYNRFQANARRQLAQGEATRASLLAIDVDEFKGVNDSGGHKYGDKVLQDIAAVMSGRIRPLDVAARLGGDEFAILLIDTSPEDAVTVGEDIRALTEVIDDATLSIGVTEVNPDQPLEENLNRADGALYGSKEHGRNQVTLRS